MTDTVLAEVFPPGEFIRDELKEREWTQSDLAVVMGRPLTVLNEIITGKRAVTPETATELGAAFGTSAEFWLNLESLYRLSTKNRPQTAIRCRARLFELAPLKDMQKRHWIKECDSEAEAHSALLRFFNVKSLDDIRSMRIAARATGGIAQDPTPAQYTWCRQAIVLAQTVPAAKYDSTALRAGLKQLRQLAFDREESRKVPRVLSSLGIRFVVVEHLPRSRIDGASLWLDDKSPVVALSMRYDRIDSFWHTLCHELAHVLNEDGQGQLDIELFVKGRIAAGERQAIERRADDAAAAMLINPSDLEGFIRRKKPYYSKQAIIQFANRLGIHPGIIVGQLQYRGEIGYYANREMLVKVRDIVVLEALTDGWGHFVAQD
jgi:HTH-type transcriptional regulator/antitoxin HigA